MGSISGIFALAAFIAGLFCTRLKTALIAGAAPALYAALVVVGLWDILGDVDIPYFLGIMMASILAILLPAGIASYLRRATGALVHRRKGSEPG
jgi:hypothetical protein